MKRTSLVICIVVIVIFVYIFLNYKDNAIRYETTGDDDNKKTAASAVVVVVDDNNNNNNNNNTTANPLTSGDKATIDNRKTIFEILGTKLRRMLILSDASVHPIEFWGKIIDQYGNPVDEVEILYYAGGGYLGGGSGFGRIKTDSSGLFHIVDREGGSLNLRNLKKEGYQIVIQPQDNLFHSFKQYPDSLVWLDYSKKNPFIFNAWKNHEDFVGKKIIHGEFRSYFKADGLGYDIDLFGGPTQKFKRDCLNCQLKVSFLREPVQGNSNLNNWEIVFIPIEGEIIRAESLYTNEAPISGWMERIVYSSDDYTDSVDSGVKSFYLKLEDGNKYARVSFQLNLNYKDTSKGSIYVTYSLNTAGTRFLDSFDGWVK